MAHRDLDARELVARSLPTLLTGPYHTTHSAIKRGVVFVGNLQKWSTFENEAHRTFVNESWSASPISSTLMLQGVDIHTERIVIGDEHGLQGRFNQQVGQVMSTLLEAQNIALKFGDFKGAKRPHDDYPRVPDFALLTPNGTLKLVGEGKAFWVTSHDLDMMIYDWEMGSRRDAFKKALGQIARYMFDNDLKYGFLTTYNQTIFLRKVEVAGKWTLEYSPVIHHDDSWNPRNGKISVRQAFYHIIRLAQQDGRFNRTSGLGTQVWTVPP